MRTLAPRSRAVGTYRHRADRGGRWELRLRERPGDLPTCRYIPGPNTAEARRGAELALADWIADVGRGKRHTPRTLRVGTYLDHWIETKRASPATIAAYRERIELYLKPTLGRVKLADLEPADVARAMRQLETAPGRRAAVLSAGSVQAIHVTLSAALQDAWRDGKVGQNVARLARVPRSSTHIEPPTSAELDAIFAELEASSWYPVYLTLRWTGARLGEVLGLERRFLDLDGRMLTVHRQPGNRALKTRASRRTLVIPEPVAAELRRVPVRLGTDLVFTSATGRPLDQTNIRTVWRGALERSGARPSEHADRERYRPHDMRHAFATLLLEAGASPSTVSAWLGHASLRELDRYGHVTPAPGGDSARRVLEAFGPDAAAFLPWARTGPPATRTGPPATDHRPTRVYAVERTTKTDHQRQTS